MGDRRGPNPEQQGNRERPESLVEEGETWTHEYRLTDEDCDGGGGGGDGDGAGGGRDDGREAWPGGGARSKAKKKAPFPLDESGIGEADEEEADFLADRWT